MESCNLFTTVLLVLVIILGIGASVFFHKNIYPELDIINKTGGREDFGEADWWMPTKKIDPNFSKFLRRKGCGWNTGHDIEPNCPYDDDTSNDNWPIRSKCSESSLGEGECTEENPYYAPSFWNLISGQSTVRQIGGLFDGKQGVDARDYGGGCQFMGRKYPYATDCKGTPNNNCCQKFDRRSGFIGGDGTWCMRCKDPRPEDVEFCKSISVLHCNES
jgi:hypothetical protein